MGDISLGNAATLALRTFPFLLLRAAVYFGIAAAFASAVAGGFGIGAGFGSLLGVAARAPGGFWGAIAGFAFIVLLLWWLREYLLYLIEISHTAAISLALDNVKTPGLQGSIAAAMSAVQRKFRDVSVLSTADRYTRDTINDLLRSVDALSAALPRPFELPRTMTDRFFRVSLGFVVTSLLARTATGRARNPYSDLRDNLILFAQNHEALFHNAVLLAAGCYLVCFFVFLASLIPAFALTRTFPGGSGLIAVGLAAAFTWSFQRALIEPFLAASFLELFRRLTRSQTPEPDWDMKLEEISESYSEVKAIAAPAQRNPSRGIVA
jgi:hypothetical protein